MVSAVVKLVLKTFQEFVRLETLNCCGYQQIQLDVHYLRNALQNLINNDPVVDALFDEVSANFFVQFAFSIYNPCKAAEYMASQS